MALIKWRRGEDRQLTPNFNLREMPCHCGLDHIMMIETELPERFQIFRDMLNGLPASQIQRVDKRRDIGIKVSRAYSCPDYNLKVGGKPNSQHLLGRAMDIMVLNVRDPDYKKISYLAYACGFAGIGVDDSFLHLDIRDKANLAYGLAYWEY